VAAPETLETLELVRADGVATITLSRPAALNAWNERLAVELASVIGRLAGEETVRSVLITGQGRAFSAGADVAEGFPRGADGSWDIHTRLVGVHHPIITGIRELPKPVIAAVNGPAVGIGCSLALCSDLILAAESAYFLLAFVNIGLVPDGGSSLWLPTRIGLARATELCMLGERLPAARALEWGLINRVVADEQLRSEASALAARLATGPTLSYAGTKRQLNNWLFARMPEQLDLEAQIQREMAGSEDSVEGAIAFVQKRPARFSGR